jgi:MSHA biogenesis protein MshP
MKRLLFMQRGFSLLSAIFLLVIIAELGSYAVTVSTTQQQDAASDVLGSRAYQAAKAGLEWGAYQITKGAATCATLTTPTMPTGTQLSGFSITLGCTATTGLTEGTVTNLRVYQLTSTAKTSSSVGSMGYVERQVSLSLTCSSASTPAC